MRGVIEEKTNRIIEVIITSVKPFELMMGKIVGIALVGLTQFMVWLVLTLAIYQYAQLSFGASAQKQMMMQSQMSEMSMPAANTPPQFTETPV
jgi:ABC-2 type transport system permease protein